MGDGIDKIIRVIKERWRTSIYIERGEKSKLNSKVTNKSDLTLLNKSDVLQILQYDCYNLN